MRSGLKEATVRIARSSSARIRPAGPAGHADEDRRMLVQGTTLLNVPGPKLRRTMRRAAQRSTERRLGAGMGPATTTTNL